VPIHPPVVVCPEMLVLEEFEEPAKTWSLNEIIGFVTSKAPLVVSVYHPDMGKVPTVAAAWAWGVMIECPMTSPPIVKTMEETSAVGLIHRCDCEPAV